MDRYSQSGQNNTRSSSAYHRSIAGPSYSGDIRRRSVREGYESFRRGHADSRGRYHSHRSSNAEQRDDGETLLDFLRRENAETSEEETCPPTSQGRHPVSPTYTSAPGYTDGSDARKRRLTAPESPARRSGHGPPNTGNLRMPSEYLPTLPQTTYGSQQSYGGESLRRPPNMNPSSPAAQGPSEDRPVGPAFTDFSALDYLSSRLSSDVVLPPWQPDHAVSKCPICGNHFSIFYRRHHCRKCGRVVCANCSPHRITIPRQFVVHPPSPTSNASNFDFGDREITAGESTSTTDPFHNPALGGGDEVRVCNPCVPDPNLSPPPQQLGPDDTSAFPDFFGQHQTNLHSSMPQGDGHSPNRHPRASLHRPSHSISGPPVGLANSQSRPRIWLDSDGIYRAPSHSSRNSTSDLLPSSLPHPQRYQQIHRHSMRAQYQAQQIAALQQRQSSGATTQHPDPFRYPGDIMARPGLSFSNAHSTPSPSQPVPAPRRQIPEEDECPICQQELPPKGPAHDEADREAHIMECIATNFVPSSTPAGAAAAAPPPSTARDTAAAPSVPSPSTATVPVRSSSMNDAVRNRAGSSSRPRRQTTNRMLVYRATEKDCVGEDGDTQECVICFEEFEEGDEMGRLECLCKFHRTCIRSWWETKGPGSCPTHQLHD